MMMNLCGMQYEEINPEWKTFKESTQVEGMPIMEFPNGA